MLCIVRKFRFSWSLVVLIIFYLYLGFHALSGDQGVLKWANYEDKISALQNEIDILVAEREALELHANQLRANQLDLDRLGEEARRTLNVSHTNEIVIWLDDSQ
ncbi:MAG: septum formation initiator family protein [Acidimicrobiales bacterium]|nr:septum formation initiator family protein [Hyphomonadaceae bacterium]RZV39333.1 MAG: septum formation initiator family protein [Acidimicrobiales bacterium]